MADLPELQSNAQVTPGPLVDSSPIYQGYAKIANDIDDVTKPMAQQLRDNQVQQEATAAGSKENFKAIPSIGKAAQVYNQVGLAANKDAISTDIIQNLNKFQNDAINDYGQVSDQSIKQYQANATAHFQGMMETIPMQNRTYAKNLWAAKSTLIQADLHKKYLGQLKLQHQANAYDNYQTNLGEVASANQQGNYKYALSLHGQNIASIRKNEQLGLITPLSAQRNIDSANQNYYLTKAIGSIQHVLNNPNQADIETANFMIDEFKNNPDVISTFKNPARLHAAQMQLQSIVKEYTNQENVNKSDLARTAKAGIDYAIHTGKQSQDISEQINNSNMSPEDKASYNNKSAMAENMGQLKLLVSNGSKNDAISALSKALELHSNLDYSNPLKAEDEKEVINNSLPLIKQAYKEKMTHPYNSIEFNPSFVQYAKNITQNRSNYSDPANTITQRAIDMQKQQGFKDNEIEVASSDTVQQWANNFEGASPAKQWEMIPQVEKIVGNNPEHLNLFFRQMKRENTNFNMQPLALMAIAQNSDTKAQTNFANTAFSKKPNDWLAAGGIKQSVPDLRNKVLNKMQSNISILKDNGVSDDELKPLVDNAVSIAAYNMYQNNASADDSAKIGAKLMLNDQYNQDNILGTNFLVPKTDLKGHPIDPTTARYVLTSSLSHAVANKDITVPKYWEPGRIESVRRKTYIAGLVGGNIRVVNAGGSSFQFRDSNGGLIKDSQGNPLQVDYSDITNPNSDLVKQAQATFNPKDPLWLQAAKTSQLASKQKFEFLNSDSESLKEQFKAYL